MGYKRKIVTLKQQMDLRNLNPLLFNAHDYTPFLEVKKESARSPLQKVLWALFVFSLLGALGKYC